MMLPPSTAVKNRNRRPKHKCSKCLTYIQLALSYMIVISGFLFLSLGAWLMFCKGEYIPVIHNEAYTNAIYLSLICGVLNVIAGFLIQSALTSRLGLFFYIVIILASMVLEGGIGYYIVPYQTTYANELDASLPHDLLNRYADELPIAQAIDFLQREGKCCGSNAFNDWPRKEDDPGNHYYGILPKKVQYIPDSCCRAYKKGCAISDRPNNIHYRGCLPHLKDEVKYNLNFIFVGTAASFILQTLAILIGCCTCVKRDEDDEIMLKDRELDLADFD